MGVINLTTASGWTKPIQPLAGEQLQQESPNEAVACESNMTASFGGEAALFVPGHQRNSSVAQSENKPPSWDTALFRPRYWAVERDWLRAEE